MMMAKKLSLPDFTLSFTDCSVTPFGSWLGILMFKMASSSMIRLFFSEMKKVTHLIMYSIGLLIVVRNADG